METAEDEKVALAKKLSDLGRQIKETEKLTVEVDRELKESDEELATKTQELHASELLAKEWQHKVALETEKRNAFFDVKQSSTGYALQSPANGGKVCITCVCTSVLHTRIAWCLPSVLDNVYSL
jgi:ribosomal protein S3